MIKESLTIRELDILRLMAEGLTNREIARELVLSPETVKWYNKQSYSKLGVGNRTQAVARVREYGLLDDDKDAPATISMPSRYNLPSELSSFVGRDQEITETKELLQKTRLVTLTGTGGTGKTRLALRTARAVARQYADGAAFVSLATVMDPELVAEVTAQELGVIVSSNRSKLTSLKHHLRDKQMLLVLDNFEHVMVAAPLVTELLVAAPRLSILVTSREALHLSGEFEYHVPPLTVPVLILDGSVSQLLEYESVALFVQRAEAISKDFKLTEENAGAIAAICNRLDGLPLAIELAAARIKLFNPHQLLLRLENHLGFLTKGARDLSVRQRTLRDTFDWSYDLLERGERQLFARLSVFIGGQTFEAAEAVCALGLSIDISDGLDSLINKSLIFTVQGSGNDLRFVMLETIREYALEHLVDSGEERQIRDRHLNHFFTWTETVRPGFWRHGQILLMDQTEAELGNLRAAFEWAMKSGRVESAARLVAPLEYFLHYRDHSVEGYQWVKRLLDAIERVPAQYRVNLLLAASRSAYSNGNVEQGKLYAQQSLACARELDNTSGIAWSLTYMAATLVNHSEPTKNQQGQRLCEEALVLFRQLDDKPGIAQALTNMGNLAFWAEEYEAAESAFHDCLTVCRETGEILREGLSLGNLAFIAFQTEDYWRARYLALQFLRQMADMGVKRNVILGLGVVGGALGRTGEPEAAARLLGASVKLMDQFAIDMEPGNAAIIDNHVAHVRQQLTKTSYEAAWEEGQSMTLDQAIAYASTVNPS
jgi:predicted ATPase/DNA-binding CsgD family transcriptional regulator